MKVDSEKFVSLDETKRDLIEIVREIRRLDQGEIVEPWTGYKKFLERRVKAIRAYLVMNQKGLAASFLPRQHVAAFVYREALRFRRLYASWQ